jgi:Acetyl-CoA carboxylase, carboxyltransferase component (subunits alpha and beta)
MKDKIQDLLKKKEIAKLGGGEEKIKAQHNKGKLSARERIEFLLMKELLKKLICL